jgi:fructokinase
MLLGEEFADAPGFQVDVADPVGTGDAFAAAFIHGIVSTWPVAEVASFSNRVGALVAGTRGAIPNPASDANPELP